MSRKTALVILAEGFEELEAIAPVDLLRRAEIDCTLASQTGTTLVTGRNGIRVEADRPLDEVAAQRFDCLVVPGGPSTAALRKDARVLELARQHAEPGSLVGAICAAPLVLLDAGVLPARYTGHASIAGELPDLDADHPVVVHSNIVTSRGAGTAVHFGLALVKLLQGLERAQEVAVAIHHPHSDI